MQLTRRYQWLCFGLALIVAAVLVGRFPAMRSTRISAGTRQRAVPPAFFSNGAAREAAGAPTVQPAHEDVTKLFPPSELPMVATQEGARASLRYLAGNGADLTRPMPSKHRVFAANAQIAAQLAGWGRANGFEVRGPFLVRSHIGEPQQSLELVRTEVPDPAQIEREGRLVLAAVQQTPGTYYQTWCGEIVR
jgi:hypothetical protein